MPRPPLTEQQHKVLEFIGDYADDNGFPPTLREIGEALGLPNVSAVRGHLVALEKKGYLRREPDKARSIRLVRPPSRISRLKRKLHRVLGTDEGVLHHVVYGLAWTTWQRRPLLLGRRGELVDEALEHEAAERGWEILEKSIGADHAVVTARVWANHSPRLVVKRLQSAGRAVKRRHPKVFPERNLWGAGYVATTEPALLDEMVSRFLGEWP
jgi:DNA-binding MarR family transcriptional regulator